MANNENNNTAGSRSWNGTQSLGFSVLQRHSNALRQPGSDLARNHLGRDRISLATVIYRRYYRNGSLVNSGADFPLVNFFSQTPLQPHDGGGESLSQYTPLGMESLHRVVDISPYKPIGIKRELIGVNMRRSVISLAGNENSSTLFSSSNPSGQSSIVASNAARLGRMPHSSHISEQAIVRSRTGGTGEKSSLDNSLILMETNTSGRHLPGLVQRVDDRQSRKGYILNPAFESAMARFAPLEHYYPDTKTAPMADAVSGIPAISPKAELSSKMIARQQQISFEAAQSGNIRPQSSVQRAVSRQNSMLSQNHYEPRDNNVFTDEASRFVGNEHWTHHTTYFASPLVTVNRKFSLSSGNRFDGLGLGQKIAGCSAGTLSQQGYTADFSPASAIARFAPLEHYYPDSKMAPMADAVSGVPAISPKAEAPSGIIARQEQISSVVAQPRNNRSQSSVQRAFSRQNSVLYQQGYAADFIPASAIARFAPLADAVSGAPVISPKAEPSSEMFAQQEQISHEAAQPGNNRSQSSVQRAISRQNNALSQNHYQHRDNNINKNEPARFAGNELWAGQTAHFASPLVTVNRKFLLSSGNLFGGLKLGRKIAGRTVGTLTRQRYAADFIPASAIARFAPLADAVSGAPIISPKAELLSEMFARQEQISHEAAQPGNNRSQSSVQRAISRQNNALSQNHYQHRDNNINKNEPARFAGNELWAGQTTHFASPLVTVNRKFSLSSGNRFEGLGLGRKIAGRTVGTSSQQGFAADFIPGSANARSALLEHYHPDSKTAPMADDVSGVPVINSKAEPSSEIIARRVQISSEIAHPGNNRSQSSVHRAVDRQNSSLSQITPEPRIRHKVPEMISAKREGVYQLNSSPLTYSQQHQHGYPLIPSNITNGVSGNPIHSNSISSLLMRSTIIPPTRTTNWIQASLGQQQPSIPISIRRAVARKSDYMLRDNSTRPVETADLNVLTLSSRANLFSSGEESFMQGTTRASPIEQGDSFYSDRGMDSATQLPLSLPYVVQRKTALSGDYAAAGDGSGYLQRLEVNNTGALTSNATPMQTGETPSSESGKSDSNALSTDDVVDKVWRKLMRKLVSEQERMGGSNRWA